jgi:hypothetical protein
MSAEPLTFGGWQRDRGSALLGLSGPRVALLGAATAAGVTWLVTGPRLVLLPVLGSVGVLCAAAAFVRIAGRTVDEWVLTAAAFAVGRRRGEHRFLADRASGKGERPAEAPDLPGTLACLEFLDVDLPGVGPMCCVKNPYERTAVVIARVRTPGLLRVDGATQGRRLAGWAAFLAGRCAERGGVQRIQAIVRAVPDDGQALIRWAHDHAQPDAPSAALTSYDALLGSTSGATFTYDSFLAVALDLRGVGRGSARLSELVSRQTRTLATDIARAGLVLQDWLPRSDIAAFIRSSYDPTTSGADLTLAGPISCEASWADYQHDAGCSATYVVEAWPSSPVDGTCLAAMLAPTGGRAVHRVALLIDPIGPRKADAILGAARTSRTANLMIRARFGQVVPERERAELRHAEQQDAERAAGHGLCRYVAYLTVTEDSSAALTEACADVEAAVAGRLDLRRLYGLQDVGFAATLPFCQGLPSRKGTL